LSSAAASDFEAGHVTFKGLRNLWTYSQPLQIISLLLLLHVSNSDFVVSTWSGKKQMGSRRDDCLRVVKFHHVTQPPAFTLFFVPLPIISLTFIAAISNAFTSGTCLQFYFIEF
jgi:hypothetical protein